MSTRQTDVVVVGAGISGLMAARLLLKKDPNLQVLVLEGKDRVGGRTHTITMKSDTGTDKFDVGGQWVGRCQKHIMDLMAELGLKTHDQYRSGTKILEIDHRLYHYSSEIPTLPPLALIDLHRMMTTLQTLSEEIDPGDPYNCPNAHRYDSMTLQTYLDGLMWTRDAKETATASFRCMMGVELNQVSLLFVLMYIAEAGTLKNLTETTPTTAQEYLIAGGAQQVSEKMAEELGESRVILKEGVISIEQGEKDITVQTLRGQTYVCKKVIMAVPPSQLGKMSFNPCLPTAKREIIKRMPIANLTKVIFTFKTTFWRAAGYSGQVVTNGGKVLLSTSRKGPFCIVFDDTTANGTPALLGFLGGAQAIAWRQEKESDRKMAVLKSLAAYFGDGVYDYIDYVEKDWESEPYTEGSPICTVGTGAMPYFAEGLRKPFNGIHFAGSESATVWCGYMSGAVQAGRRAALEVLLDIRPQVITSYDIAEVKQHSQSRKRKKSHRRKIVQLTVGIGLSVLLCFVAKKTYDKFS